MLTMIAESIVLLVLPALFVAAAACDMASFTIPNRIQIGLILAFALFAAATGMNFHLLGNHALAGGIGLLAGFSLFAFGYVGGGDAKLFAAAGLWFGMGDLLPYTLIASVLGGALTLGLLAARQVPLPQLLARQGWILRLHDQDSGIPYGIALAAGALSLLPYSEIFRLGLSG
jgi:prepilin peptidase CpaA